MKPRCNADREKQRFAKSAKADAARARTASANALKNQLSQISKTPKISPNASVEEKEAFFLSSVSEGETLVARGEFYSFVECELRLMVM